MIQQRVIADYRKELELAKQPGYVSRYDEDYDDDFSDAEPPVAEITLSQPTEPRSLDKPQVEAARLPSPAPLIAPATPTYPTCQVRLARTRIFGRMSDLELEFLKISVSVHGPDGDWSIFRRIPASIAGRAHPKTWTAPRDFPACERLRD